jgi:hypothetical protein
MSSAKVLEGCAITAMRGTCVLWGSQTRTATQCHYAGRDPNPVSRAVPWAARSWISSPSTSESSGRLRPWSGRSAAPIPRPVCWCISRWPKTRLQPFQRLLRHREPDRPLVRRSSPCAVAGSTPRATTRGASKRPLLFMSRLDLSRHGLEIQPHVETAAIYEQTRM